MKNLCDYFVIHNRGKHNIIEINYSSGERRVSGVNFYFLENFFFIFIMIYLSCVVFYEDANLHLKMNGQVQTQNWR